MDWHQSRFGPLKEQRNLLPLFGFETLIFQPTAQFLDHLGYPENRKSFNAEFRK
jgi:hypothetical protein